MDVSADCTAYDDAASARMQMAIVNRPMTQMLSLLANRMSVLSGLNPEICKERKIIWFCWKQSILMAFVRLTNVEYAGK